jgi:hypothetical protein
MPYFTTGLREDLANKKELVYAELWIYSPEDGTLKLSDIGTDYADLPRVIRWEPIRYSIDLLSNDIGRTETGAVCADTDGFLRNWLTSENRRGLGSTIWWQVADDPNNYASMFYGILDSWDFEPGKVTLRLKSDDRWLRTNVPRVKILKSEFPDLTGNAIEYYDTYVPLIYGTHLSTSLGVTGMVQAFPLKTTAGTTAVTGNSYAVALGNIRSNKAGTVTTGNLGVWKLPDGGVPTAVTPSTNDTCGMTTVGGKDITVLYFGTTTLLDSDLIFCDIDGSTDQYNTRNMVSNPVEQLRNFLLDHVFFEFKSGEFYHVDNWYSYVDADSWANCIEIATNLKLEGTLYVGGSKEQRQARDVVAEWLVSWPMFRLYIDPDGRLKIVFVDLKHPGYVSEQPAASDPINSAGVIESESVLSDSYKVTLDAYNIVDRISCEHTFCEAEGRSLRSFEVQDMSLDENVKESVQLIDSPRKV